MAATLKRQSSSSRDAEATRNSILDAAQEEFARAGLLGARTESIAAKTGVTKCMLFYYFENKEGLYKAVLERAIGQYLQAMQGVDIYSGEPKDVLRSLVEVFLDHVQANPDIHTILVYEGLQNKGKFYGQLAVGSVHRPLVEVLERGVASGQFRKLDPIHAAVNIIGMCVLYFSHYENVKHLWPGRTDRQAKEMAVQHKKEAIEQAVTGVLAPETTKKRSSSGDRVEPTS